MNANAQDDFVKTLEANKGIIYKIARLYCNDPDDKQDLIQEIIFQLWRSFDKFDRVHKFSTWMYRIALNVAISYYRKEKTRGRINESLPDDFISLKEDRPDDRNDDLEKLHQFIQELKEMDRALMILYLEGTSQQEIASILGLTVSNVSTKVQRIKEQLKKRFESLTH